MAEKIVIGEIQIDMEKALREAIEYKKQIGSLKAAMKEAKETTGESSVEYVKLSAEYKAATAQLRSHETMLQKVVQTDNAATGSMEQMRAKLSIVSKEWSKLSEEERKNTERGKALAKQKLDLSNAIAKEEMATGNFRDKIGEYERALSGLPGPIGAVTSKTSTMVSTLKRLGPVVGIIIAAAGALLSPFIAFFTKSEKGFEMMERKMAGVKAAWNVMVGEFIRGGEKMSESIDNAAQKTSFWEKVTNLLGSALSGITGNPATKAYFEGLTIRMGLAAEKAEELAGVMQDLDDLQREMIVPRAQANQQMAEAKLLHEDETKAIEDRVAALERSLNIEIETNQKEIELQAKIVNNIKEQNQLRKESGQLRDEDLLKEEEAKAKLIELETESMIKRRKLQSTLNTATEEMYRRQAEIATQAMQAELQIFTAKNTEIEVQTRDLLQKKLPTLADEFTKMRATAIQEDWENQNAILEQTLFGQLELEKQRMDKAKQYELQQAEFTGANKLLIEKKYAKAERKIEETKRDAKLALAAQAAQGIAELFGESTKAGKLAASAMVTIESIRAAQGALTGMIETFPGPWGIAAGIVAAAAQIAIGVANVRKIWAVKEDGGGGGGDTSSGPSAATAVPGMQQGMVSTQTSIGNGIVSRDTVTGGSDTPQTSTVLVVDDVTSKQRDAAVKEKVSTL
jgi:hypothetical protein